MNITQRDMDANLLDLLQSERFGLRDVEVYKDEPSHCKRGVQPKCPGLGDQLAKVEECHRDDQIAGPLKSQMKNKLPMREHGVVEVQSTKIPREL